MKFSNRRRWTKSEKWLLFAPLLVGVFAGAMNYAPKIFGKMRGNPDFVLKTAPGVTLTSIALSRDGASLVATGFGATIPQNGDIWIWNARNLQLRARWPGGPRNPNGGWASRMPSQMAWSLDGKRLMFGRMSEPFQSVDVASRRVLWSWGRASYEDEIRLSPDGRLLFLPAPARGNNEESAYALLDAATGKVRCRWSVRGFPGDPMVSFAPDGKTLASIGPRRGATKESWYVDGRCRVFARLHTIVGVRRIRAKPRCWHHRFTRRLLFLGVEDAVVDVWTGGRRFSATGDLVARWKIGRRGRRHQQRFVARQ